MKEVISVDSLRIKCQSAGKIVGKLRAEGISVKIEKANIVSKEIVRKYRVTVKKT